MDETTMTRGQMVAQALNAVSAIVRGAEKPGVLIDHDPARDAYCGVETAQYLCHGLAVRSGWWTDLKTGEPLTREQVNIPEKLCLVHSEVSEAMEGARKGLKDDHLPHRDMLEVELADAVIRILDLAGFLELDLAGAMLEKLAYNQQRADHKLVNRTKEGGKAF